MQLYFSKDTLIWETLTTEGIIDKYGLPFYANHDRNNGTDGTNNNSINLIY